MSTSQIFEYLSNVMYARRNKFDPYWNALLVAGVENGEPCVHTAPLNATEFLESGWIPQTLITRFLAWVPSLHRFLAHVDLLGVTYSSPSIATGFGMHLAQPLLRKALDDLGPEGEKSLSEDDARKILENAMRVLFYRDARSLNKVRP